MEHSTESWLLANTSVPEECSGIVSVGTSPPFECSGLRLSSLEHIHVACEVSASALQAGLVILQGGRLEKVQVVVLMECAVSSSCVGLFWELTGPQMIKTKRHKTSCNILCHEAWSPPVHARKGWKPGRKRGGSSFSGMNHM